MRTYISVFLCLILLIGLPVTAFAAQTASPVYDYGNLLSAEEEYLLEDKIQSICDAYGMDTVILTLDSLDGKAAQNYADDFYDSMGYGDDGVLFLLAMAEREWYISTCGKVSYALTDYGISQIGEEVVPGLSGGYYYEAFDTFLECLPYYLEALENNTPIDGYADYSGDYYHGQQEEVIYYEGDYGPNYLVSILVGLAVAAITVLGMRGSMNSRRPQKSAASYLKSGSYHLRTHQDLFLYSNISKVRRQQNNNHHGGGSSMHHSSGGRSHGGGGGRF